MHWNLSNLNVFHCLQRAQQLCQELWGLQILWTFFHLIWTKKVGSYEFSLDDFIFSVIKETRFHSLNWAYLKTSFQYSLTKLTSWNGIPRWLQTNCASSLSTSDVHTPCSFAESQFFINKPWTSYPVSISNQQSWINFTVENFCLQRCPVNKMCFLTQLGTKYAWVYVFRENCTSTLPVVLSVVKLSVYNENPLYGLIPRWR